ncbi:putative late blight resistance proteinR1A-10 [Sesamum alatum]|uniref:Late blight resistance proteinR1A-10 n=1 Tax=Sesamum alatum TaxID=300844 RepID=A0AAE1YBK1_9LAMI|nr:putative late blight resistance proteinR1A-10 [Sesamum alatum]
MVEEHGGEDLQQVPKSLLPDEDDTAVSSQIDDDFRGKKTRMLGLDDEISEIKNLLIHRWPSERRIVSLVGMAGIGKTALAREVYEHPSISSSFDCRLWATIGPEYQLKEIMLDIVAKLNLNIDEIHTLESKELAEHVNRSLQGRRYLIVLDDIWRTKVWSELEKFFPDNQTGSRILLTSRLHQVAVCAGSYTVQKRFLNEEECWYLLCEKVFDGEHSCPPQLEKAGKKIAENCEGLPLAVIAIRAFKLGKLWCSEGFIEANPTKTLEDRAMEYLEDLVFNSVVLDCERSFSYKTKTCRVHTIFRYLCINEADKQNLFHVINSTTKAGTENIKGYRRLCIHNNALLGIKDVRKSMAFSSHLHSLLCTGPHHKHPVRVFLDFRLLWVLDALTIRFYKFPIEVVELVFLKYLAFTYNGELPASISKLWNLRHLIVHQHLSILSSGARRTYLPGQIWKMRQLRHLEVMEGGLPDPNSEDDLLPNLSTLLLDAAETSSCFDHLADLHQLESLKCFVVNPNPKLHVVALPNHISFFPLCLKKLTLSGLGFPWEYMSSIALLLNLEVLKLRCYAFGGTEWVTSDHKFYRLKYLLLEDIDLEYWYANRDSFPKLHGLIIRHCYKLRTIPLGIG